MTVHSVESALSTLFGYATDELQVAWLVDYCARTTPAQRTEFAEALKLKADTWRSTTAIHQSLHAIHLLYTLAAITQQPLDRAIALRADGNTRLIGLGEFQAAIRLYDEAAAIYEAAELPADAANAQVGKVWALAMAEAYEDIAQLENTLPPILEAAARWQTLANFYLNLGAVYGRIGQDAHALTLLNNAKATYIRAGETPESASLAMVDNSRAIHLRNIGEFSESVAASQSACQRLRALHLEVEAANAEQTLAATYLLLGRYQEALQLFEQARAVFYLEKRWHQVLMMELSIGDCLLYLRRYEAVLERTTASRHLLSTLRTTDAEGDSMQMEAGQVLLMEATAHAGLRHTTAALDTFNEARLRFEQQRSPVWMAICDLERAQLHLGRQEWHESQRLATDAATVFEHHQVPTRAVQALLLVVRSALGAEQIVAADTVLQRLSPLVESLQVPLLVYQLGLVQGELALATHHAPEAIDAYERAVNAVEQLRGWLMVELRSDFVADKQIAYEKLAQLWVAQDAPERAFAIVERAKSRALLDLLAYRLDLTLEARHAADDTLVEELRMHRSEWDRLFRMWEQRATLKVSAAPHESLDQALLVREKRMTELWQTLLMRDAAYAREAALWQVHTEHLETIQSALEPKTALIEYFSTAQSLYAFVLTDTTITCIPLSVRVEEIRLLQQQLQLNLTTVPRSTPTTTAHLARSVQSVPLKRLYDALIAPLGAALSTSQALLIVPHGSLHYLPFHAFHDGTAYLMETHTVSYLPSASIMPYCNAPSTGTDALIMGYSNEGHLAGRVQEAHTVANLVGGDAAVEQAATLTRLRSTASHARLIHLATHGYFHRDNPRFSGVVLADGYLTTLDIFGLRLPGSLVTLSACQTKQSHLGGGDELLGMSQAFLHAGATGLVMSQWAVSDSATLALMQQFYTYVAEGVPYAVALQRAYQHLASNDTWAHPFFWAAFFFIGTPTQKFK